MKSLNQKPTAVMSIFKLLKPEDASKILPGVVMFLPPREVVPKGAFTDHELLDGAFNHPVVVLSIPVDVQYNSHVELAIMTSFHGTAINKHVASKGMKYNTGNLAAHRLGYLRVATESKPFAKDTLKLRNGKAMKREFCYVNVKKSYMIELQALSQYGFKEPVDAYRLTVHSMKKLYYAVRSKEKLANAGAVRGKARGKARGKGRQCKEGSSVTERGAI